MATAAAAAVAEGRVEKEESLSLAAAEWCRVKRVVPGKSYLSLEGFGACVVCIYNIQERRGEVTGCVVAVGTSQSLWHSDSWLIGCGME